MSCIIKFTVVCICVCTYFVPQNISRQVPNCLNNFLEVAKQQKMQEKMYKKSFFYFLHLKSLIIFLYIKSDNAKKISFLILSRLYKNRLTSFKLIFLFRYHKSTIKMDSCATRLIRNGLKTIKDYTEGEVETYERTRSLLLHLLYLQYICSKFLFPNTLKYYCNLL